MNWLTVNQPLRFCNQHVTRFVLAKLSPLLQMIPSFLFMVGWACISYPHQHVLLGPLLFGLQLEREVFARR